MTKFALATALAVSLMACADEPPPSCAEVAGHYYGAGCVFVNLETGTPYTQAQFQGICQTQNASIPAGCNDAWDEWLWCLSEIDHQACVDCSQEQDALGRCGP